MKNKRNHKGLQGARGSVIYGMRQAFIQHTKRNGASYAPALSPVVFFFLAHVLTLVTLVFMQKDQVVCKTVVTWAVYGFLPFLLCSYVAFYLVARPSAGLFLAQVLDRLLQCSRQGNQRRGRGLR